MVTKTTTNGHASLDASIFEMACSFLHYIAARPKIILYTYMVKWIIDQVDVLDREFKNTTHEVMVSFSRDNLRLIYNLPKPWMFYNK